MALVINTNIMSLNTQNQLAKSSSAMSTAMERLSSGLRINSAKDDAAGLAISDRMTAQINGLNQAVRNANDGISLAQTAEGAMGEMTNILQRMREIAVQSANDTNTAQDRLALQDEMDQMYSELDRIASTTQFNGQNILDGTLKSTTFQIGANAGQTLSVALESVTTQKLGLNGYSALGELNTGRVGNTLTSLAADDVLINGESAFSGAVNLTVGGDNAATLAAAINANSGVTGVSADAYNTLSTSALSDGVTLATNINGTDVTATSAGDLVELINRDVSGVTAALNADNSITLSNDTGNDIDIANHTTLATNNVGVSTGTYSGYMSLNSTDGSEISVAANTEGAGTVSDVQALGLNASQGSDQVSGGVVTANSLTDSMDITINGVQVGASDGASAADKAAAINAIESETNVEATAYNEMTVTMDLSAITAGDLIRVNGVDVDISSATDLNDVVTAINSSSLNGVVAEANTDGELLLKSSTGLNINVAGSQSVITGLTDMEGTAITMSDSGDTTDAYSMTLGYSIPEQDSNLTLDGDAATEITIAAGTTAAAAATQIDGIAGYSASVTDTGQILISKDDGTDFTIAQTGGIGDPLNLVTPSTTALGTFTSGNVEDGDTLEFSIDGGSAISVALEAGANVALTVDQIVGSINGTTALQDAGIYAENDGAGGINIRNMNTSAVVTIDTNENTPAATAFSLVTNADGIGVGSDNGIGPGAATAGVGTAAASAIFEADVAATGSLTLTSTNGGDVRIGGADADELGLVAQGGSEDVVGSGLSVTSAENASVALGRIDDALTAIDSARSSLGAVQNRFESTISNLSNVAQNLTAARSRIVDADFAQETTNLSRSQVLQQAGTAMLAQANASSQNVLSLLG